MSGTPGHSGGARPGAGRKPKARAERIEPILLQLDERLEQTIDARLDTLEQLAKGGLQTVTERWELAGTLLVDQTEELLGPDGTPTGQTITRKVRLLPDRPADELVLVSRTVKTLAPNLAANVYLINRLVGKPTPAPAQTDEPELNTLSEELEQMIDRIYGTDNTTTNHKAEAPVATPVAPSNATSVAGTATTETITTVPPPQPDLPQPEEPCQIDETAADPLDTDSPLDGFVAGTLILTADGEQPIEQIQPGDQIWSRSGWRSALALHKSRHPLPVATLILPNNRSLTGTITQPLWVNYAGWIGIEKLRNDRKLLAPCLPDPKATGNRKPAPPPVPIIRHINSGQTAHIWTLELEEHPEYFAEGVLVRSHLPPAPA